MLAPEIQQVVNEFAIAVPALDTAATNSQTLLTDARNHLRKTIPPIDDSLDVVVLGSLARLEVGEGSDFDFLVVAHRLPTNARQSRELLEAVGKLNADLLRLKDPGATRMFGRVISAPDMTERIGLEDDTNRTHSHRILLIEESRSIYQPDLHSRLLRRIAERYLLDYGLRSARFLLNDVLRYWRTLTVDYQAKRWENLGQKWGLRFLKLVISRKITLAGTVASILLEDEPTADSMVSQFEKTPLARLCGAFDKLEAPIRRSLGDVVAIADRFTASLNDVAFRDKAEAIQELDDLKRDCSQAYEDGQKLQKALETIFFDSSVFRERSRRYLAF